MKKIIVLLISALVLVSLSACSDKPSSNEPTVEDNRSLEEIMGSILEGVDELPAVYNVDITSENFNFYLFIDPIDGAEAIASEAMISSIAHSVCLLRLPENADVNAVAGEIEKNADPRKWICVGAEKVTVLKNGRLICLIMSSEKVADKITENFIGQYQ